MYRDARQTYGIVKGMNVEHIDKTQSNLKLIKDGFGICDFKRN